MGVGKTTIGEQVAKALGRRFVDTDQIISERMGKSVPEIFAAYGEPFFRALEASVCAELGTPQNLVISTGGGALVRWENLRAIAGPGNIIICLTATPDVILERLANDRRNRPLVNKETPEERLAAIADLLQSRQAAYNRIRIRLETTHQSVEEMTEKVLAIFQAESERNAIRTAVYTPTNRYTILTDRGVLDDLANWLEDYNLTAPTVVVTDENVAPLYGQKVVAALPQAHLVTMPVGEQAKNLQTMETLYRQCAQHGLDRSGVIIALGGGVVGDTVGFLAATYMRGVALVQIPTTLLAMVDSSVGGKVGVDLPEGKNLVGAFKQPELVLIDPQVLASLPPVELRCGLAEALKHALIGDPELVDCLAGIAAGEPDLLRRVVQVKVDIVQRDPYEQGERAHLNLGHTFAHAIERVSHYAWRHGEAVGVGLVAAGRLSQALGHLRAEDADKIEGLVADLGLPTRLAGFAPSALWEAMATDKKWRGGHNHFILLEGFGRPFSAYDVPSEAVLGVLEGLCQ
jgi:3-dehydroquinate synthase